MTRQLLTIALVTQLFACGSDVGKKGPDGTSTTEAAVCGNGVVEAGEACDTSYDGDESCESMGSSGTVSCNATCSGPDLSACSAPLTCGNGAVDPGELCDGEVVPRSCADEGFTSGTLACAPNCLAFDTTECIDDHTECRPVCDTRTCGADPVCGVSCGTCSTGVCTADGVCETTTLNGFSADPLNWTLPPGGSPDQSYFQLSYLGYQDGDSRWFTADLDGDGTTELIQSGYNDGSGPRVLGPADAPHWLVYQNDGEGFAAPTLFRVPAIPALEAGVSYYRSHLEDWDLLDIDGDGDPDLVRYGDGDRVWGYPSNPHWLVYRNLGGRFEDAPLAFSLPVETANGVGFAGFNTWTDAVDRPSWRVMDINGDRQPDLIVTARGKSTGDDAHAVVLGGIFNPRWEVYLNEATGFAGTPLNWAVPGGGGNATGFFNTGYYDDQVWTTRDIDGDGLPELVVMSDCGDGFNDCVVFGTADEPHWKVYDNNGGGFDVRPTTWPVPVGGEVEGGFNDVYGGMGVGSERWAVADLNNDQREDLIVTGVEQLRGEDWKTEVLGYPATPHWRVFWNEGDRFAAEPQTWPVPSGGRLNHGFDALEREYVSSGGQQWFLRDLTSDGKLDLVVTSETPADSSSFTPSAFGMSDTPHWRVYPAQ